MALTESGINRIRVKVQKLIGVKGAGPCSAVSADAFLDGNLPFSEYVIAGVKGGDHPGNILDRQKGIIVKVEK